LGLDLLGDRIAVVAFKDYVWHAEGDTSGKVQMRRVAKPLSQGMVPWTEVLGCLSQAGYNGWISLHREYGDADVQVLVRDVREDVAYLNRLLDRS